MFALTTTGVKPFRECIFKILKLQLFCHPALHTFNLFQCLYSNVYKHFMQTLWITRYFSNFWLLESWSKNCYAMLYYISERI
nr:MAG TPA: signalosome complex subunit 7a protein [Caudoviricetes sp.]